MVGFLSNPPRSPPLQPLHVDYGSLVTILVPPPPSSLQQQQQEEEEQNSYSTTTKNLDNDTSTIDNNHHHHHHSNHHQQQQQQQQLTTTNPIKNNNNNNNHNNSMPSRTSSVTTSSSSCMIQRRTSLTRQRSTSSSSGNNNSNNNNNHHHHHHYSNATTTNNNSTTTTIVQHPLSTTTTNTHLDGIIMMNNINNNNNNTNMIPTAVSVSDDGNNDNNHAADLNLDDDEVDEDDHDPLVNGTSGKTRTTNTIRMIPKTEEEKIIHVVDQVEDDWEERVYDFMVPLEIKLALERNVFGWSHLTTDILGHLFFTCGAFFITFMVLYVVTGTNNNNKHNDNNNNNNNSEHEQEQQQSSSSSSLYSYFIYYFLLSSRWLLSIIVAWSTFRMVRRRRRVWFRAPYGSMKYRQDTIRRQQDVEMVDQLSWIQRIHQHHQHKKLRKQLQKAEKNFMKHHERRYQRDRDQIQQIQQIQQNQNQDINNNNNNNNIVFSSNQNQNQKIMSPIMNHNNKTSLLLSQSSSLYNSSSNNNDNNNNNYNNIDSNNKNYKGLMTTTPYDTDEDNNNNNNNATTTTTTASESESELQQQRRLSFRTESVRVMQSVQHDQIIFTDGPIKRVPYVHGGGYGAAPFMLANPHWISVLRYLMPDVYVEISRRVSKDAPAHQLIHWAENNPVVAAYATAHELEYNNNTTNISNNTQDNDNDSENDVGKITTLEWDVFLDPYLVNRVRIVLQERRTFLLSVLPELPTIRPMEKLDQILLNDRSILTSSQKNVILYYERELRLRTQHLVDQMLIAHGNITQLFLEQTGYLKHYNYSRVKRTRRTLGGGIYARQWMAVYAESLRIGLLSSVSSSSSPVVDNNTTTTTSTGSVRSSSDSILSNTISTSFMDITTSACPNTSIAASVAIIRHITKCEHPIGLILDAKSRHVPNEVWACVVDMLRESGVRIEGVGTFIMEDIRMLRHYTVQPVQEVWFFHSAGDLQYACHQKMIRYGDHIFFNGGSLLWSPRWEHLPTFTTAIYQCLRPFDANEFQAAYRLQPYALSTTTNTTNTNTGGNGDGLFHKKHTINSNNDDNNMMYYESMCQNECTLSNIHNKGQNGFGNGTNNNNNNNCCSTIEDYKKRYNLSIGLYVQEFAIDNVATDLLVQLVNEYPNVYNLGLSWGGINGITLRGIRPGRFTETTGYWNQRHVGRIWNPDLRPPV